MATDPYVCVSVEGAGVGMIEGEEEKVGRSLAKEE